MEKEYDNKLKIYQEKIEKEFEKKKLFKKR